MPPKPIKNIARGVRSNETEKTIPGSIESSRQSPQAGITLPSPAADIGSTKAKTGSQEEYDVFRPEDVKHVGLKDAVKRGLVTTDEAAFIDGLMESFPESYREHFEPRFSEQRFKPTPEQLMAHKIPAKQGNDKVLHGVLLAEKIGELKTDAKHLAVMFKGADVTTFLHEFGEFAHRRLLTPKDRIIVKREWKKSKVVGESQKDRNEWFSDQLRDWYIQRAGKKKTAYPRGLREIFRRVLRAIKGVYARARGNIVSKSMHNLFEDIVTNGREIKEKYYYSDAEVVAKYVVGSEPGKQQLQAQGFSGNSKTYISWDPGSICPKQEAFVDYMLNALKETGQPVETLANVETISALYDAALADGVDVPCSYCYVEQARRKAISWHQKGKPITGVNFAMAKQVFRQVPYKDAILKWSDDKIKEVNKRGGLRMFSFSDYIRGAHRADVERLLNHAKLRGLSVKAITKNPEFVEDFAGRGITINVSIDGDKTGRSGMNWDKAAAFKKKYPNVKVRTVAINPNDYMQWSKMSHRGIKKFVDVITPYHHDNPDADIPTDYVDMGHNSNGGLWLENLLIENPDLAFRTCCQVGGKCFDIKHQKQCSSNCGNHAGNLTIPANIGDRENKHEQNIFYSGLPAHAWGKLWTEGIGTLVWDKAIIRGSRSLLEKIPGGKAINRALLYDYRGNLPNTAGYIKSREDMQRYQAIGREYAIDLGNRLQQLPEDRQLAMGEYIRGEEVALSDDEKSLADEAKRALYDLGRQAVDAGLLDSKTFFKNAGRYMPRLYTSKEYASLLTRYNVTKPNRLDLSRFKRRKDIPKAIREQMGEILTPGYPVAKGIIQMTHDVELAKHFRLIAGRPSWSLPRADVKATKQGQEIFPQVDRSGWEELPIDKKLGDLSGAMVHPEIFKDIQELIKVRTQAEKVWRKTLGAWKFGKVILSPKTHARNLMSNSVLAHLGGLPLYEQPYYLTRAAKAMRGKDKYWKMAKEEGLLQSTFTNAELRDLFDGIGAEMKDASATSIAGKFGKIGEAWQKSRTALNKAAQLYEAEEQWFKMAKFIHNVEAHKMSSQDAAKDAEKWLFNYGKITRFQEAFRSKWYGAPFATFTFKAIPRIAEAAIKTPWRFALPMGIIYALNRAAREMIGDEPEEEKAKAKFKKPYMTEHWSMWPRVPLVDEHGREYYLNLTYVLPWGDLAEGGGWGPIPGGLMPFSQPFLKTPVQMMFNYDFFWKDQIVKDEDLAGKTKTGKAKTIAYIGGKHLVQALAPTPVMDVSKAISSLRKRPDYRGRMRASAAVYADILAGIKMYPVDYAEEMERRISKKHPKQGQDARKLRYQIKTLMLRRAAALERGGDPAYYDKQVKSKLEQLRGLAKELGEEAKTFSKIGDRR
jgi:hypothetical protein